MRYFPAIYGRAARHVAIRGVPQLPCFIKFSAPTTECLEEFLGLTAQGTHKPVPSPAFLGACVAADLPGVGRVRTHLQACLVARPPMQQLFPHRPGLRRTYQ